MSRKSDEQIIRENKSREGKKGGDATFKRHGSSFYARIARKRWKKNKNGK